MRTLGIIPARGGSKRLPKKNLRMLGGKPLVAWAIETAKCAKLDRVVVSSDDPEILRIADELALARPADLATDTSLAIDYIRHALAELGNFDVVVVLQPTSPFTLPEDVDKTVALLDASGADTAVTVMEIEHAMHPLKLKVMEGDRLLPYSEDEQGRMAAHELPKVYVRNGSVYATRKRVIEGGGVIGEDCRGYRMPRERSIDINDELDLAFAEFLLASGAPSKLGGGSQVSAE